MQSRRTDRGFTLIEMLISLAIVAAIVTMVYGSYAATSRAIDLSSSRMACSERAQLVLRLMACQIRCAYLPASGPGRHSERSASSSARTMSSSVAFQGSGYQPHGEILGFTTTRGFNLTLNQPVGLSRIAYQYDPSAGTLSIACFAYGQGTDPQAWRPVLGGIRSVALAFHDGTQWQPQWDSDTNRGLPQAVRIAFTLVDDNGRERQYGTAAPIASRTVARPRGSRRAALP